MIIFSDLKFLFGIYLVAVRITEFHHLLKIGRFEYQIPTLFGMISDSSDMLMFSFLAWANVCVPGRQRNKKTWRSTYAVIATFLCYLH